MVTTDERRVGVAEQRNISHRQGTHRFTVITALQADKFTFIRTALILPGMQRHLERNFRGAGTIRSKEGVTQSPPVLRDRRSASSIAGAWVKPASITCSRWLSWSVIAALIRGLPCPNRLTHQELMPSNALAVKVFQPHTLGAGNGYQR